MWRLRSILSSGATNYGVGSDKSTRGDTGQSHASKPQIWYRIISNLTAGGLVALSLIALTVVVAQGVFRRDALQYHDQADSYYFREYGKDCRLGATGFVPGTCTAREINSTNTPESWNAIGVQLATLLKVPRTKQYPVTVCWQGASDAQGWAALELLVGYDYYPECCPQNGSQPIIGFANIELGGRSEHPEGVYIFTGFSDEYTSQTVSYTATDGTQNLLIADIEHTAILMDGTTFPDPPGLSWGTTSVIPITPLGQRYMIFSYNIAEFYVIADTSNLKGWSTGLHSKLPISTGWICGHVVENYSEVLLMQIVFSLISIYLFWGDIYITFKGLGGVLHGKPVLTYDVLSGLERRKLLMFMITLNSMPSILYVDVALVYYGTDGGFKIWTVAIISLSILAAFVGFIVVTMVQYIPSQVFIGHRVITFSAPAFLYASIISVASNIGSITEWRTLNTLYNNAPGLNGFNAFDKSWISGYYTAPAAPAINYLFQKMWGPVLLSFCGSILYSNIKLMFEGHFGFIRTEWMTTNTFLSHCGVPNWITSMPVATHNAIRIGNRWFCKPTTQVLFGYASVVPQTSTKVMSEVSSKSDEDKIDLISIYDLGWTIVLDRWMSFRPKRFGTNEKNKFTKASSGDTRRLLKNRLYKHTRGSAID